MVGLRGALRSLIDKVNSGNILIKPADKGSITVIMTPSDYWDMCLRHLENTEFYEKIHMNPSDMISKRVILFANKYKKMLTNKEFEYLTQNNYKHSNFYMLPKLHKSKRIDDIIKERNSEYIHVLGLKPIL